MDIEEGKRLAKEASDGPCYNMVAWREWERWAMDNAEAMIARIEELEAGLDALKGRTCEGCGKHRLPECRLAYFPECAVWCDENEEMPDDFPACGEWE